MLTLLELAPSLTLYPCLPRSPLGIPSNFLLTDSVPFLPPPGPSPSLPRHRPPLPNSRSLALCTQPNPPHCRPFFPSHNPNPKSKTPSSDLPQPLAPRHQPSSPTSSPSSTSPPLLPHCCLSLRLPFPSPPHLANPPHDRPFFPTRNPNPKSKTPSSDLSCPLSPLPPVRSPQLLFPSSPCPGQALPFLTFIPLSLTPIPFLPATGLSTLEHCPFFSTPNPNPKSNTLSSDLLRPQSPHCYTALPDSHFLPPCSWAKRSPY